MKKILIFGGTTEGRELAQQLCASGRDCVICVATEYGEQVLCPGEHLKVHCGRLDVEGMQGMYRSETFEAVIDATHPYATLVTRNIRESLKDSAIPYYRLAREKQEQDSSMKIEENEDTIVRFSDMSSCVKALNGIPGKILLTTGTKDLPAFCENPALRERLVVRILPGRENLEICAENGLEGKQIIAMQGPFSEELNLALIRQFHVTALVTKESGKTGGLPEKLEAAKKAGIAVYMIEKPGGEKGLPEYSMREILEKLGVRPKKGQIFITLAGIGMGAEDSMTLELRKTLEKTEYLFGAPRMIENITPLKEKYPFYLEKDLIPCLQKLAQEEDGDIYATVLFSGDSGFYSGSSKLYRALSKMERTCVTVLPGISSIAALAAKCAINWEDATIISMHGVEENLWISRLLHALRHEGKVFFLTSGVNDLRRMGEVLEQYFDKDRLSVCLGYRLSYPDEEVLFLSPEQCKELEREGLYSGFVVNEDKTGGFLPGWEDERFLRDKVPMTKEEIRTLSICKLKPEKDAVIFDIGSGTGSVAMELAALSPDINVFAIETNQTALKLIEENRRRFGLYNIRIVDALAPAGLEQLPAPTHAFIGGSKGNLEEILDHLYRKNPHMRIVMNAISMESICTMHGLLAKYPTVDTEVCQVSVSKTREAGSYHLMQANNPVMIFAFTFKE